MEMRSFSDYLRSVDDAAFLNLFNARPDLITPVPADIASLAVRACSAPSLARAIELEDAFHHLMDKSNQSLLSGKELL